MYTTVYLPPAAVFVCVCVCALWLVFYVRQRHRFSVQFVLNNICYTHTLERHQHTANLFIFAFIRSSFFFSFSLGSLIYIRSSKKQTEIDIERD